MKILFLALASLVCMSAPAYAQTLEDTPDSPPSEANSNTGYIGVAGFLGSEYLGSAKEEFRVLPYLSLSDVKGFDLFGPALSYRAVELGTGLGLGKWSLRAGPIATYQSGRDSDDSNTLTGLDDINGSLLIGGYARSTIGPVGLRFDAGQDILGGHDGLTANASIGTLLPLGRLNIQPSATVSWASKNHNQSFFGITPEQSAISGLDTNEVGSGIYSYSVSAVSWFELTDDYTVTLIGSHRWFTDEASNSPILQAADGSDKGLFISLGFVRRFRL